MSDLSSRTAAPLTSVCVYCGSSNAADPAYMEAAYQIGADFAKAGLKLVYGGGGVGLMGAAARGAHEAGGKVLGIIPDFLRGREQPFDDVETVIVTSMHERKMMMFERSDAFVVLPGGIGTLEEIIELLSWRRLDLHRKPIVFHSPGGFWEPLFALLQHTIDRGLTPPALADAWRSVEDAAEITPTLLAWEDESVQTDVSEAVRLLT
ncbi:TIGR00730 family Rossman fold protein [Caulobacter sp.]|uniref:LOG family protein n=1 Tax=Caulobacter sp. TaxID=78 RepID=UPI001B053FA1|nr:TIGR00730 family Rossman fold protein [Caulobacter sp.]MBO9545411.1 TIGR00730 family Rossman fold protein [Caulobacter sp.]